MNLLVDMNLSPSWVSRLARSGFEAVHWSMVGAPTAADEDILAWAREHRFVLLSDAAISAVVRALQVYHEEVAGGALLSIDESGTRVRMLPLRRPIPRSPAAV